MGKDELHEALNRAADGPERDFTNVWSAGRRMRRRRQGAQGLGVLALVAMVAGGIALGGGDLMQGETMPPATPTVPDEVVATSVQTDSDDAAVSTAEPTPTATAAEETTASVTEETTGSVTEETSGSVTGESTGESPSSEGGAPGEGDALPTSVEEYARAFVNAGMAGDDALLERMGADSAVQASVTWTSLSLLVDDPRVIDTGENVVHVIFFAEGPYAVPFSLDRSAVEAGAGDGVLHGEQQDAPANMSVEDYADRALEAGTGSSVGVMYTTEDVDRVLKQLPTDETWLRSGSSDDGDLVLVTYQNDAVDGDLVLTVDRALVEERQWRAVVAAEFSGDLLTGAPDTHPCDEPWSPVPLADLGDAPANAATPAQDLLDGAATCNLDFLAGLADQNGTMLSFGALTPAEAFSGEQGRERARALGVLLATYEPVLETGDEGQTVAEWPGLSLDQLDELVELGLYTEAEVQAMRDYGAYTGWRIAIDEQGQWLWMIEGD